MVASRRFMAACSPRTPTRWPSGWRRWRPRLCEHGPRSREQRRADALGALAAGADRLGCRCGRKDCAAGKRPAAGPVVIHVIAEQATLEGRSDAPASEVSADGLISPELIQELARSAKLVALVHPGDAAPENG